MKRESEIFANENFTDDENIKQLIENLDKEYKFLKEEIKDNELQSKLIMYILDGKIKQIPNKEYRKKILEYILNDNNLILKSGSFLAIILNKEIAPSSQTDDEENIGDLIENYLSFAKEHNDLYGWLEKNKDNKLLDEILLYLFESYVMLYFENIEKDNEKDIIKETLFESSLKYLDKSLCYIDNMLKNGNNEYIYPHLALLMSVAYIRVYLSKFRTNN